MKTKITKESIGNLVATLTSDVIDGRLLDTKVEIEGKNLCSISGLRKDKFLVELNEVITKYRI